MPDATGAKKGRPLQSVAIVKRCVVNVGRIVCRRQVLDRKIEPHSWQSAGFAALVAAFNINPPGHKACPARGWPCSIPFGETENMATTHEHTLTYSYPTSDNARKLGFAKKGCYSVRVDEGKPVAFEARQQAETHIKALGTTPSLYSLDNPRYDENIAKALYETVLPSARTKQATA